MFDVSPASTGIYRADPVGRMYAAALVAFDSDVPDRGPTRHLAIPASTAATLGIPTNCKADGVAALADCGEPVSPGVILQIFLTGLGKATPGGDPAGDPLPAGELAPGGYNTVETPEVTIGGMPAIVDFSGLAPGFSGLYQINARVPLGALNLIARRRHRQHEHIAAAGRIGDLHLNLAHFGQIGRRQDVDLREGSVSKHPKQRRGCAVKQDRYALQLELSGREQKVPAGHAEVPAENGQDGTRGRRCVGEETRAADDASDRGPHLGVRLRDYQRNGNHNGCGLESPRERCHLLQLRNSDGSVARHL